MEAKGIIVVDKPAGFTSFDVIAKLRGILGIKKLGHSGTLDPMATGVLPVFAGSATKAIAYGTADIKEYIAGFQLGMDTDTQDRTGAAMGFSARRVSEAELLGALGAFRGESRQVPPMYSALKVDGKRLYDLARAGKVVERPARRITVFALQLLAFDPIRQTGTIRVLCSKGTYIRTLLRDIGLRLGAFATMTSLRRIKSGDFSIGQAKTLEEIEKMAKTGTVSRAFLPVDTVLSQFPKVHISAAGKERADKGAFIWQEQTDWMPAEGTVARIYFDDAFVMLGKAQRLEIGQPAIFVHKKF